jgi:hypothetical protein
MGCSFCSTSAMFGGKGRFVDFYRTGDELFAVMRAFNRPGALPLPSRHPRPRPCRWVGPS